MMSLMIAAAVLLLGVATSPRSTRAGKSHAQASWCCRLGPQDRADQR